MFKFGAKAITFDLDALQVIGEKKRCYQLSDMQVAMLYNAAIVSSWSSRWTNATDEQIIAVSTDLKNALINDVNCGVYTANNLPDGVNFDGEILTINCEDNMIVNFNGCGCGCCNNGSAGISTQMGLSDGGSGSGSGGGGGGGGGGIEPLIDRRISTCDVASYLAPYILAQSFEFLTAMSDIVDSGEDVVDSAADGSLSVVPIVGDVAGQLVDVVTTIATIGVVALKNMADDSDFLLSFQKAFVAVFGQNNAITSISRNDLFAVANNLPLTYIDIANGSVLFPRIIYNLFFRVVDMNKINGRLLLARDKADAALCEYLFSQVGEIYTPQPTLLPPPINRTLIAENSLYQLYEVTIPSTGNELISVGDVLTFGEYDAPLSVAFTGTLISGTSFGNAATVGVRFDGVSLVTHGFGGNTDNIGIAVSLSKGLNEASNYINNNTATAYPTFTNDFDTAISGTGTLDIYMSTQAADWRVRIDEFYYVLAK